MSPYLLQELSTQIKRILNKPLALIDQYGTPFDGYNDFAYKQFRLGAIPSRDRTCLPVDNRPELQAIPIYVDDRLAFLIVLEVTVEDIQTIQIVSSLAELIVQQFLSFHKPRPDAVDLLLTRLVYKPHTIDQEELEQQMAALGHRLDVGRVAVLIELEGFWDNYLQTIGQPLGEKRSMIGAKKQELEQTLNSFFSKNQDNIIGYVGNNRFLVLKDLSTTEFDRFYQLLENHFAEITAPLQNVHIKIVKIGVGSPANSSTDILVSAREALQALDLGIRLMPDKSIYRLSDLGVVPLLFESTPEQKRDFVDMLLGELDDVELMETLRAFLTSNLNLTQTSEMLKIHRNTVIYRLDKITDLVGKDPRHFVDAVEFYLAIQFKDIFQTSQ